MPKNLIEKVAIIQNKLDQSMVQALTTSWMEINHNQVQYNGGDEIKIPSLLVDGLGNYEDGYKKGHVKFKFSTKKLEQDRGTTFSLDVRDVDETGGLLNIANIMNVFQREHVASEIDAYRISKLAQIAKANEGFHREGEVAQKDVINILIDGITKLRENGFTGEILIHATHSFIAKIQKTKAAMVNTTTYNVNGIDTEVFVVNGCKIIPTDQARMFTEIELLSGENDEFGFKKTEDAEELEFMIVAKRTPVAITKLDTIRVFDPMTNQDANGWKADYRRFHDIFVLPSNEKGIYISTKGPAA